jgi:hypothetical protein
MQPFGLHGSWTGKGRSFTWSIEREKAELARFHEAHRNQLQELSSQRQDALSRNGMCTLSLPRQCE